MEEAPSARPAPGPHGPSSELEAPEGQDLLLADNVRSTYACLHYPVPDVGGHITLVDYHSQEAPCPPPAVESDMPVTAPDIQPPPWPLPNMSTWRLMQWALSGDFHKSDSEVNRLVRDVLQAPDFDKAELSEFDAKIAFTMLERAQVILPGSNPLTLAQWRRDIQICDQGER